MTFRIPYKVEKIDISKNTQKEPWFLEINPNGRIPALTDTFTDGKTIRLFESGSIMQYLIAEYDEDYKISFPAGSRDFYEMNNWLFFMNAGVGPMQVSIPMQWSNQRPKINWQSGSSKSLQQVRARAHRVRYQSLRERDEAAVRRAGQAPSRGQ